MTLESHIALTFLLPSLLGGTRGAGRCCRPCSRWIQRSKLCRQRLIRRLPTRNLFLNAWITAASNTEKKHIDKAESRTSNSHITLCTRNPPHSKSETEAKIALLSPSWEALTLRLKMMTVKTIGSLTWYWTYWTILLVLSNSKKWARIVLSSANFTVLFDYRFQQPKKDSKLDCILHSHWTQRCQQLTERWVSVKKEVQKIGN